MPTPLQPKLFRTYSKLSDELITIDSPKRNSKIITNSMYNTIQLKNKFSQSKNTILAQTQSLWLQSATTNTREKSPSFKFPQAQRFSSFQKNQRKNRLIIKLNIAGQIAKLKGATLTKSKRVDHFKPKKFVQDYPSPASYCSQILDSKINTRRLSIAGGKRPSLINLTNQIMSYEIKGITVPKQKNPSKVFMHHGQKISYQPEVTMYNPGVGKYNLNPQNQRLSTKMYCIGQTLKKFNQFIAPNPGPGAYGVESQLLPKRVQSANCRGTFQRSKRTYLVDPHPQNFSPSPDSYKLKRFLQK